MARIARVVLPDCSYHLTHRGNRGEAVFFTEEYRHRYLWWLHKYAERYALEVWAYCLMTNHVHLIALSRKADSLARTIGNAHRHYSRAINGRHEWTGHLWANRFYSTPLDEAHLWLAVRYVELNPVRAGIVQDPTEYRWSSAAAHAGLVTDDVLSPARPFPGTIEDWRRWLAQGLSPVDYRRLRSNTSRGRPSGSKEFVAWFETKLSRTIRPRRAGRPRKRRS
jgi:putative transposase